jgi:hypothetical protein
MNSDDQIIQAIEDGKPINAIKMVMESYGVSLAEAKAYVDELSGNDTPVHEYKEEVHTAQEAPVTKDRKADLVDLPNTTAQELLLQSPLIAFLFGILLLLGFFFPFLYHAAILFFKVLVVIMFVASIVKVLAGQIPAKMFLGSLILNLATLVLLASFLVYPNGLVMMFSPVVWVSSIVFMIVQVSVVLLFGHPILEKFKGYFRRRVRWA